MRKLFRRVRFILNVKKFVPFLMDYFTSGQVTFKRKLLSLLFIGVYFVLPFDLIPDFLTFFGFFDDIAVLTWILQKIIEKAPQELKDKYGMGQES
ncbi:YkvA family protein [Effusibacillus lacus]|uniref:YkvA family protein n=1 Tax=Effusibacillus lacus TaxID=1348429 RepID=UPI000BB7E708|nr:DUF1232 domain-containing protein [Effusibacillus lacus]TCS67949.1 uncharacterized protein DUF1232 [Effusibacillus lacus]